MKKTLIGTAIILVLASLVLVVAKNNKRTTDGSVKVGAVLFLTGNQAVFGEEIRNSLLLANEVYNADADTNVELLIEDSQDDPKAGISAYNKLKQQGVSAMISAGDQVSYALSPLANNDKLPLVMTAAAAGEINGDYTFRSFITARKQAEVVGNYAVEDLKSKNIGVLYINNIFGESYLDALKAALHDRAAVVSEEAFNIADSELRTQITKVIASEPDAIVISGFGPGYTTAFNQLRQYGWRGSILTVNTLSIPYVFNTIAPANLHDTYFTDTNFDISEPANAKTAEFIKRYKEKYKTNPSFIGAFAYDMYTVLGSAIQKCGSDPEEIKDCLLDIQGVDAMLGDIDFSTHEMRVPLYVKKVEDGTPAIVKVIE
ncbi:ABC transporter substrate-binding protein [Candidatus Kaiserbacteria bacterium]|nr:ABC transporter substrate-binding protein [Candidatus Kaiserbacteria bacterium]